MPAIVRLGIMPPKLFDYLLNPDHAQGASKARFFVAHGFSRGRPEELGNALVWQALRDWPGDVSENEHAVKYRIMGPVQCPDGRTPQILTVWQAAAGDDTAMLVTARPHKPKLTR